MQFSIAVRNARLASIEATVGPSPLLRIYSGAIPANCAASASGTLLLEETLPADWLAAPTNGTLGLLGTWSGTASAGDPTDAGYFRIYEATGATCHFQGVVTATGGGGDLTMASIAISAGQGVTITPFGLTDGNG